MKLFSAAILACSLSLAPVALAGEVTYVAALRGIECQACKKTVAQSLGRLPGVQTIRITAGSKGIHTLTAVTHGSAPISMSQAIQTLGKKAPHYQIVSWKRR